ncbi:hypothetical protein [Streptomyces sp. VRA16 Mangrove soil]|uniref:hypothetical protein n=1 Tax=Streptomyces sp. VRA16 Mangrove soil TaxID=2817434 RepID=UPI001A9F602C|nr:hypothetical protein [Streptomyces sp. VRA16 Mangrove soil]MBO1335262.1 hypothetical protein [Streptomyces sp. VRA16 Mangrove soil]
MRTVRGRVLQGAVVRGLLAGGLVASGPAGAAPRDISRDVLAANDGWARADRDVARGAGAGRIR